ncbi:MAG TPA: hypothetical protein V6D22_14475 [Candidatus Obscuribacterales bacterium]
MSHSKLWLPVLLALATCPLTPLSAKADVPFRDWAKDHQEWVTSHRDRYNYFMQHPEDADRHADEWRGMNGNGNGLGHAYGHMKFTDWARGHQDWVNTHHDRYNFFMQHPDQCEQMRPEWEGWSGHYNSDHPEWGGWTPQGTSGGGHLPWSSWCKQNPQWASAHKDRYNYFMQHPDQAEKCRSEWEGWRPTNQMAFNNWAHDHQDWVRDHHDRYDYFMHHPDQADKCRSEWQGWHPSNKGLHLGEVAHSGIMPGHMNPHMNAGLHLGNTKALVPHTNEGLHLGNAKNMMPHNNHGLHLGELAKIAPHGMPHGAPHGMPHVAPASPAGFHLANMIKQMPHAPAAHAPAAMPHISAAARALEMTHMGAPHKGR